MSENNDYRLAAERGDAPLLPSERLWGFWEFTYANSALAIATWAFLIGGAIGLFVGPKEGIAAIVIGNIIGVVITALATCVATGRYGIEQFVFLRSMFGANGSRLVYVLAVVFLTLGWLAVLGLMFGHSIDGLQTLMSGGDPSTPATGGKVIIAACGAILLTWFIVAKGPTSIKFFNMIVAPALLVLMVVMMALILSERSFAELMALPALAPPFDNHTANFIIAVEVNIAAGMSWWPYLGNLARLTRSERVATWPNLIGIFGAAVLGEIVGLLAAVALGNSDPTIWMAQIGGVFVGVVALVFVAFANITSMANILYTSLIGLRQVGTAGVRANPVGTALLPVLRRAAPARDLHARRLRRLLQVPGLDLGAQQRARRDRHRRLLHPAPAASRPARPAFAGDTPRLPLLARLQPDRALLPGGRLPRLRRGLQPAVARPRAGLPLPDRLDPVLPGGRPLPPRAHLGLRAAPRLGRLPGPGRPRRVARHLALTEETMSANYDYIIVGAGSAGCVLAARLTEDPGTKVLVLEFGGSDRSIFIQMPSAFSIPMNGAKYNWRYHTAPEPGLDGRSVHCPRGKVLGGSSSINGLVYMRGHAHDFDEWEALGARGWGYRNCLPYFRKSETFAAGGDEYRGGDGPLHVTSGNNMENPLYRAFVEAGDEAGYGKTDDPNGYMQEGFGPMHMTIKNGVRWSTANAYLRPAMSRPNLHVVTRAMTRRVLIEEGRAVGVEYERGGTVETARCSSRGHRRFRRDRLAASAAALRDRCGCRAPGRGRRGRARPARRRREPAGPFRDLHPVRLQAADHAERQDGPAEQAQDRPGMDAVPARARRDQPLRVRAASSAPTPR